jgi:hypothetical protein
MLNLTSFLLESKENFPAHIEDKILSSGMKGAKEAISSLDILSDSVDYKTSLQKLKTIYADLNTGFVNRLASMDLYAKQFKTWLDISPDNSTIRKHIDSLEDSLNKNILGAVHHDTKRKRITEKNAIINFWSSNIPQIILILQFRNTILKMKK